MSQSQRKQSLIDAARVLFAERGFDAVGMREVCKRAAISPIQAYRIGMTKIDLLAEVSMELTQAQIVGIAQLAAPLDGESIFDFCKRYLTALYDSDIRNIAIRKETAAFGWKWSNSYEERMVAQVLQLLEPIKNFLVRLDYTEIDARCLSIWSLYYVGFRGAVTAGEGAEACYRRIEKGIHLALAA